MKIKPMEANPLCTKINFLLLNHFSINTNWQVKFYSVRSQLTIIVVHKPHNESAACTYCQDFPCTLKLIFCSALT